MPTHPMNPAAKTLLPAMQTRPRSAVQAAYQTARGFARRLLGRASAPAGTGDEAASYVGVFQGVIETDAPRPVHRSPAGASARASGFVRLDVCHQKKATGCFLFFVDGEVLSGAIEGASNAAGFVDASFRLSPGRTRGPAANAARPVAAVGRLHLEARHARGADAPGEDLTIRFV